MDGPIGIKDVTHWNHTAWTWYPTGMRGSYNQVHAEILRRDRDHAMMSNEAIVSK